MQKITHAELVKLIVNRPGAFPVGLLAETDARCVKKDRETGERHPFGEISKISYSVPFVGAKYEAAVNREASRQGSEGTFQALGLPVDREWLPGAEGKVLRSKSNPEILYLRTQTVPGQRLRNKARVLAYRGENGQFLSKKEVKPFLPVKSFSQRQASVGVGARDGNEGNQVDVRDFKFASLRKVKVGGEVFEIV